MIENDFNIAIEFDLGGEELKSFPFTKDQFLSGVRTELERILSSQAGQDLAASLRFHAKKIVLIPYPDGEGNAQEWWTGKSAEENNSIVRFTPARGRAPSAAEMRDKQPATLSHEMLFHELVHSLRRISGKMRYWGLKGTGLTSQGNIEEFIAILVTNIFISDVTNHYKTGLRQGWYGHSPLEPELADSYGFFALGTKAFNLTATFCDDNPGFTKMLSRVAAHFNPIAAYYKNRRKAFDVAANGDAESAFAEAVPIEYVRKGKVWTRWLPFAPPLRK